MGRILDIGITAAYDHEGYAAHLLTDGTLTSAYSADIDPRKTGILRAACSCGWSDPRQWDNDSEHPGGFPSEDLEDCILAPWEAHVRGLVDGQRSADTADLEAALCTLGRNAKELAAADGDVHELVSRIRINLIHASEVARRLTREDA